MDHPDDEERASPPSIAALVEDLTDVRWSHPAWLSLAGGTALLERMARWRPDALEEDVYATYLSANGSPRSDTFMARDRGEDDRSAAASIDVAMCMSSIRHVRRRDAALRELRRVVRPGGSAHIVELDPLADSGRARRHRDALRSTLARLTFDPLLLRTCPTAGQMADLARAAGWQDLTEEADPHQPVYLLRLR